MVSILLLLMFPLGSLWQNLSADSCQAQLETRQQGSQVTLVGHCHNGTSQALKLRYEMTTDKHGQSGTSHNTQSGYVTVSPRQSEVLAQSTLAVQAADQYRVRLRLFGANNILLAQDSVIH